MFSVLLISHYFTFCFQEIISAIQLTVVYFHPEIQMAEQWEIKIAGSDSVHVIIESLHVVELVLHTLCIMS